MGKYIDTNENKHKTYLCNAAKAVLRVEFIAINILKKKKALRSII